MWRRAASGALLTGVVVLAGCATGIQATSTPVTLSHIGGVAMGGNQPLVGATVKLWAATTTGVASANTNSSATAPQLTGTGTSGSSYFAATNNAPYGATTNPTGYLASATTGAGGGFSFNLSNGSQSYTCPSATTQLYLTASGGNPGLGASPVFPAGSSNGNPGLFLVLAFGNCGAATANTQVIINEVTTIAAAYALQGFVPAGGQGFGTATDATAITSLIASSTTNGQGLADAFANATNIVGVSSGAPYTTTPNSSAGNGTGTVPAALIDTLANILVPCVNSNGATSGACGTLYTAATPPTGGPVAPVNTWQAALDIANYPANNVSTLYSIYSGQPSQTLAFGNNLAAQPNDFSMAVSYTQAQLLKPLAIAIDNTDDVYVAGSTNSSLLAFSSTGVLSAASQANGGLAPTIVTAQDNVRSLAFDPYLNLWMSDGVGGTAPVGKGLLEYFPATGVTNITNGSYTSVNNDYNNYAVAVDNLANVWTTTYKKATCTTATPETTNSTFCGAVELAGNGTTSPVAAPTAYTPYISFPISATNSTTTQDIQATTNGGGARAIAFDVKTGNFWTSDVAYDSVSVYGTTPQAAQAPAFAPSAPVKQNLQGTLATATAANAYGPTAIAIDASSNAWVVAPGGAAKSGGAVVAPSFVQIAPANTAVVTPTGIATSGLNGPTGVVVDGNNNIFVSNTAGNSVLEYNQSLSAFESGTLGFAPGAAYSSSSALGTGNLLILNSQIAVDRTGAIWVLNPGATGQIVQILGLASPSQPIVSVGGYGVKP